MVWRKIDATKGTLVLMDTYLCAVIRYAYLTKLVLNICTRVKKR